MRPPPLLLAAWPVEFPSPLGPVGWGILAAVPVGIIALYFLKLRRRPVQVPSTLLWRRSLEDLHVNSLFQRLRRNLLLFLQLAAVLLAMLALARPTVQGLERQGQRLVLAIDESASMGATDVEPTRLDEAKVEARKIVDAMNDGDLAMIIAFSDKARVVSSYTGNKAELRRRLDSIAPTEAPTSLREALQLVAGLANPQKQVGEGVVATSVVPPRLFLFTDGGFGDVEGFSLGNIQPQIVVVGPPLPPADSSPGAAYEPPSDNVAILALEASRDSVASDTFHIYGRAHNYRAEPVETRAVLLRRDPADPNDAGTLIDAVGLEIEPRSDQGFEFDLAEAGAGSLEVRLEVDDALPLDDRAYATFGRPRKAQVLVVTAGNPYIRNVLEVEETTEIADVTTISPDEAKADDVTRDLAAGRYDLVILDRARLDAAPEANTLSFGILPSNLAEIPTREVEYPVVLDWDLSHPLMQYIRDLGQVAMISALSLEPPRGATELIQSNEGPLAFTVPRGGYVDAVVTFPLAEGGKPNTNWVTLYSYPLFMVNALRSLGHADRTTGGSSQSPGQPVAIRPDSPADEIRVVDPKGRSATLDRTSQGSFLYTSADRTGLYRASWGEDGRQDFAVNLFDARESDLAPRGRVPPGVSDDQADRYRIKIGYNPVQSAALDAPARKEWWWPIALGALGVVLVEWYVYNRRIYI